MFKTPFPLNGEIVTELSNREDLKINITSEQIDTNVFNDNSGNQNIGFAINDYKPNFDIETLEPKKVKNTSRLKTSILNGAF